MEKEEFRFVLLVIAVTVSTLAWIFNGKVEASLGLGALQALRRSSSVKVNEKNSRGVTMGTDPWRIPVTVYIVLLQTYTFKYFESNTIYVSVAFVLRLYLIGEMWTRNMRWTFRCIFDLGIRTQYFDPLLLLKLVSFAIMDDIYGMTIILVCPWAFVSLNPDTPMAALITWSSATSYIIATRITTDWAYIILVQVSGSILRLN